LVHFNLKASNVIWSFQAVQDKFAGSYEHSHNI